MKKKTDKKPKIKQIIKEYLPKLFDREPKGGISDDVLEEMVDKINAAS